MRRRWLDLLLRLDEWISNLLLTAIVVLLTFTVTLRYVFRTAWPEAEELVSFSFVWFVYLSMVVAARQGRHFRVEFFVASLAPGPRRVVRLLADAVWLGFNAVVIVQGVALVRVLHRFKNRSPMLGWSMEYLYVIVPLSFTLASLYVVADALRAWSGGQGEGSRAL